MTGISIPQKQNKTHNFKLQATSKSQISKQARTNEDLGSPKHMQSYSLSPLPVSPLKKKHQVVKSKQEKLKEELQEIRQLYDSVALRNKTLVEEHQELQ